MSLTTEGLIQRSGVLKHVEYEDVAPIEDGAGFYAFRAYPPGSELAQIVTKDGRPAVRCYVAIIVLPSTGGNVSSVKVRVWLAPRWRPERLYLAGRDPFDAPPGHPDAPNPNSALILAKARLPINLDETDASFIYDHREDVFLAEDGRQVTPVQILDEMYLMHCRTLRLWFRIRWNIGTAARHFIRHLVWSGQDVAMWALLNFYDVELTEKKEHLGPFHKYKPNDFRRVTDKPGERSHFFGFQSSQKSFLTNLVLVVTVCLLLYRKAPHEGLLLTIYNNTALTTAALVFAFLLADTLGPWLLILIICTLARFRDAVLFMIRKVKV